MNVRLRSHGEGPPVMILSGPQALGDDTFAVRAREVAGAIPAAATSNSPGPAT